MFQTPRGTRDLMPDDMRVWNWVISKLRPVVESYGFQQVETPAYEHFDLLAAKSGEDVKNEIFAFEDKSGRMMGLRFDGTVPVARIVASNPSLLKPIRFYYISRFWRYDEPQAGRYREHWQLGIELMGSKYPEADADVMACAANCIRALGLKDFKIHMNDRRILLPLFSGMNADAIFRIIDKIDKKPKKEIEEMLRNEAGSRADEILEIASMKGEPSKILDELKDRVGKNDGIENLTQITELLKLGGLGKHLIVDMSIVRGLGYYTGAIFELKDPDYGLTIVGGGRYDNLVGVYGGQDVPATGFGMGIDRVVELLQKKGLVMKLKDKYDAVVVPIKLIPKAFEICESLRREGLTAVIDVQRRNLSNSIEYASKIADHVIIVGERDMEQNMITLRNLKTGKEWKVKVSEIGSQLKLSGIQKIT